jgi:hypothetical protein
MNGVYLRGVTHTPTYPAVEELRPEDVNLDLPESLHPGRPAPPLRIAVLGITMFVC